MPPTTHTDREVSTDRGLRRNSAADGGEWVEISVNGRPARARQGETLAAALLAAGHRGLRRAPHNGEPRGIFCGMGVCYDCLVSVNGHPFVRACLTIVEPGLSVETGE